jgi:hypothetical protein
LSYSVPTQVFVMLPSEEEGAKRIARSEALKNQVRNTQQASLFLSEVAKIRCHTSQDDLQQGASLVQQSNGALQKSQELRRKLSRKAG